MNKSALSALTILAFAFSVFAIKMVNGRTIPESSELRPYTSASASIEDMLTELANILSAEKNAEAIDLKSVLVDTFQLDLPVYDDLRVPANGFQKGAGITKPDLVAYKDNFQVYGFDAASAESIWCYIQLPHTRKEGSDIHPHIHWAPTTTDTGHVVWVLSRNITLFNGVTSDIVHDTILSSSINNNQYKMFLSSFGAVSGSLLGDVSAILGIRVKRLGGDARDTYPADAGLFEFDIHVEIDKLGSINESGN